MIGFLLWMGARRRNHELRQRLAQYAPLAPPPPPAPMGVKLFAAALVFGTVLLLVLGGHQSTQPPQVQGVVDIPQPRPPS